MVFDYHVAQNGSDLGQGTKQAPFLSINKAASLAVAGDTVIVHEGIYREWVKPQNPGLSNKRRITYKAADDEKVVIKGSEQIKNWEQLDGSVWRTVIPNSFFGNYNPFKEKIYGDWVVYNPGRHLGDVYLNGKSFYEAETLDEVKNPVIKEEATEFWSRVTVPAHDPEGQKFVWFADVDEASTTVYANFHDYDPNDELTEINVRQACFYPEKTGMDYITVQGFEMAQAATPWTPPTGDQPGLIGPHWSKGWIIENNDIHDSKCSGISLGKEISTGDNYYTKRQDKPGYHYQIETVFEALKVGWSKETVGSHIVRNNTIHDCGQNGVVGHLGCIFSEVSHNHIYNIAIKRQFYGHEIAGIKLHAAIDTQIHDNRIHDCTLGIWLDWQLQGTRVSRNLFYRNNRDLFVEVSSGPFLVDHNILTADYALDNHAQGGAYVNNIVSGHMEHRKMLDRSTPYHEPHSTDIKGFSQVYGGDDRWFNNIFIGEEGVDEVGTSHYKGYTTSLEEYIGNIHGEKGSDHSAFNVVEQPVYINNNAYLNGALPFDREEMNLVSEHDPKIKITEEGNDVFLELDLPDDFEELKGDIQSTDTLERVRLTDAEFENPDGSDVILNKDLLGNIKEGQTVLGPLSQLKRGKNRIKVWG
ncbi:right-handed parallel beta-helix repeat-containing protein [Alkalibacterium sp. f15]|uniref:right-handed parallel beta-helix repeat-containing protein n=1 Tax=Alkalibacterium sp. f15 TaxID=3414029 RepID=UPI003BF86F58